MRGILIRIVLLTAMGLCMLKSKAQVNVNINVGAQPVWGPVGYDYVDYYYLPDIETYYSVPKQQYIYLDGPKWVYASALPTRYKGYDIYRGYKVVINQPKPYLQHNVYKVKYQKYKGVYGKQVSLKQQKYKQNGNNGKGNGKGKKKGKY